MAAKRILLVEDEEEIADILALVLRGEGYVVDTAATVAQARRQLRSLRYALVNSDLRLPDGDGLEIVDRAAELGAHLYSERLCIPVVARGRGPARGSDEADASERIRRRGSSFDRTGGRVGRPGSAVPNAETAQSAAASASSHFST